MRNNKMMQLWHAILCVMLAASALFACEGVAHAGTFTVTGRLQYTRNWTGDVNLGGYEQAGSILKAADRVGVKPLPEVKVCLTNSIGQVSCNSDSNISHGYTNGNGDFTTVISFGGAFPGGGWIVTPIFTMRALQGSLIDGARVVATSAQSDTTPLKATIGPNINPTPGGTTNVGTLTFTNCTPASSTSCPNDYANGFATVEWVAYRTGITFGMQNNVTGYKAAIDGFRVWTDRVTGGGCGSGSNVGHCCNFDNNSTDIRNCFHESGHQLLERLRTAHGVVMPNFNGQCAGEEAQGEIIQENEANLMSMLMVYSEHDAGAFPPTVNMSDFCSTNGVTFQTEPYNKCSMCEAPPNLNTFPRPNNTCGEIKREECRGLRAYIDLVDDVAQNGAACLSESTDISFAQLVNYLGQLQGGTGEGQTGENQIGPPAQGNSVAIIDAFSTMDIIRGVPGVSDANAWKIWENACSMPGEALWPTGWFGSQFANPPPF